MTNDNHTFDQFCIVELFGHQKIAGRVTEQQIGGQNFIRVDVPATKAAGAFTKLFGAAAIYAITPTDEETATLAAQVHSIAPVELYSLRRALQIESERKTLPVGIREDSGDVDDDEPFDDYDDD